MLKRWFQTDLSMFLDGCEGWRAGRCQRTVGSKVIDSLRLAGGGPSRLCEGREFAAGLHPQPTYTATVTTLSTCSRCQWQRPVL